MAKIIEVYVVESEPGYDVHFKTDEANFVANGPASLGNLSHIVNMDEAVREADAILGTEIDQAMCWSVVLYAEPEYKKSL